MLDSGRKKVGLERRTHLLALATAPKRGFLLSRRPPRAQLISIVRAELCRECNSLPFNYLEKVSSIGPQMCCAGANDSMRRRFGGC